jgi:hypothetical protein
MVEHVVHHPVRERAEGGPIGGVESQGHGDGKTGRRDDGRTETGRWLAVYAVAGGGTIRFALVFAAAATYDEGGHLQRDVS